MRTAALLPASGNAAIARYWCRNYEQVWRGEADELVVLLNGGDSDAIREYERVGARVAYVPYRMGHGEALDALLGMTSANAIMLVEDDAYVREPGAIRSRLERALAGEIIGAARYGMSPEIERAAFARWGELQGPDGSYGPGLWPCFLFARTGILRETGMRFGGYSFAPGALVPGLNYRVQESADTDTMSAMAFVLRDRYPITLDVQYKELWEKNLPPQGAPYFHAGGFSTLDRLPREGCGGTNEGLDWAHRCFWWKRIGLDVSEHIRVGGLEKQVEEWGGIIEPWINWDDRP